MKRITAAAVAADGTGWIRCGESPRGDGDQYPLVERLVACRVETMEGDQERSRMQAGEATGSGLFVMGCLMCCLDG